MKRLLLGCTYLLLFTSPLFAAAKQHVIIFGKWTTVKWLVGEDESKKLDLRIRPLIVDGRTKEYVIGAIHDVTERTFVAQRAYRLNDSLPEETGPNRWRWERGGWLLVDRITGKVQAITLPGFDPYQSSATWFRDYAAYCGLSEDASKILAVIVQLGKRKPLLKKSVAEASSADMPDSQCAAPLWQRVPSRVTFEPSGGQKFTYSVRSQAVDMIAEDEDENQ